MGVSYVVADVQLTVGLMLSVPTTTACNAVCCGLPSCHRLRAAPSCSPQVVQAHGWRYHRMDGCTPVASRSRLIDDFNLNPEVFVFLLTTKVHRVIETR